MGSTEKPVLSIVIVNSDGRSETVDCLRSIYANGIEHAFEVILVDNASDEPVFPEVSSKFPEVVQLQATAKQGFAKNYNLGIAHARGKYVMILNNDTLVPAGTVGVLIEFLNANPDFGMAGPLLRSANGRPQPVSARRMMTFQDFVLEQVVFDLGLPLGRLREWVQQRRLAKKPSGAVECISGACMLVRRAALEAAGRLDERYDFYFEDIEWCRRFQRAGYRVGYVAEAEVIHLGDRSLSKVRYWAKQSEFRGAALFFFENGERSRSQLALLRWSVLAGYLIRALAFSILGRFSRRRNQAAIYWRLLDWLSSVSIVDLKAGRIGTT